MSAKRVKTSAEERIFMFSSESVNEGHPDKLADQVACETCTKDNMVMVFGEITTAAKLDYDKIVKKIGFDSFVDDLSSVILATLKSIKLKNGKDATSIYNRGECNLHINPSGKFIIGGPQGDAGLTGRKIIIDTYGGWGAHGGGAFSGKDPTKVDRSAAYACRWMAKSVVKSGLAKRACVQLSYAIGVAKPLSLFVETYGTEQGELTAAAITDLVKLYFDCRPGALARDLALRQPKYNVTAAYCHFGREPYAEGDLKFFSWEDAKDLSKYAGMKAADIATEVEGKKAEILTKWVD
ncbi:S-adenosylmethionine synthetase [Emiliania huxleyi CCMP1516]|uniref:methionine adenosyltransferase n=2 Tax=Emiliania huxleyi TaxID=2903 RepID=A0A0D3KBU2_EMIH1|nr:S-adenosylmethionine synthetase [Emiliania huxleyi CCMP1516]EOD33227.1 S-adenosylmethionine synthetase [Emiliania huxleyi CCMP1516]|eukprot:XP_005785656.1 S-adenosylmethionine synthetase [Emiliania huxleyi CCMP1516]